MLVATPGIMAPAGNSYEAGHQGIFDQVLTLFVVPKLNQEF
jgi:hypothetical protein